jgi:hypothetical protein
MGVNERKTEFIVSQHFQNDTYKKVHIEMQKSDIPKINKLLKYASKKGGGVGCPEFIITFKEVPNFSCIHIPLFPDCKLWNFCPSVNILVVLCKTIWFCI